MDEFDPQDYDPGMIDSDLYDEHNVSGKRNRITKPAHKNIDTSVLQSDIKEEVSQKQPKKTPKLKKEPEGPGLWKKISSFLCDPRLHGALGVALILFAGYVLIASISFFASGKIDQSVVSSYSVEQIAAGEANVENLGGPTGAVAAQVLLTNNLGIGALVMIIYLSLIGLAMLRVRKISFWKLTFKSLLIAITLSVVAGLLSYGLDSYFLWGGEHGRFINMLLFARFGWIGAVVVSVFLVSCVAFVYLNELRLLYNAYRKRREAHRARLEQERLEKIERDKRVQEGVTNEVIHADQPDPEVQKAQNEELHTVVGFAEEDMPETFSDPHLRQPGEQDEVEIGDIFDVPSEPEHIEQHEPVEVLSSGDEVELTVTVPEIEKAETVSTEAYDPTAELSNYHFPSLDLLKVYEQKTSNADLERQDELKRRLTKTLADYKIQISKIEATVGATITLYEIIPVEGTRIQQIKRLGDDLMLSLSAKGIRIIAPIPGKGTIGIEVPNIDPQTVPIRNVLSSREFQETKYELPIAMGTTISNQVYVADLAKMPHLLVAGATGQGKSVGLNTIIASLLYKKHPATLKFVLIDPKMVEFSLYSRIERHYLAKLEDESEAIITAPDKVITTLNSLCVEMENRYGLLRDAGVRSIVEYNNKFIARQLLPSRGHAFMPYIVIIVDEFADLIMTAGKEIETPIARIAQKARAVGIHMIIATQRPSTNVITGIIKANFPGRIAFKTSQGVDSKTILDRPGANMLIGRGDMLILNNGVIERVQCAFVDTPEVDAICNHIQSQVGYEHAMFLPEYVPENQNQGNADISEIDPLFAECARFIVLTSTASTSSLQRRYSIGYNRAGKIIDQMEAAGIVGPAKGSKPREVLMDSVSLELLLEKMNIH